LRHAIDALFSRLWVAAIKAKSGLPSAYAMNQVFAEICHLDLPKQMEPYEAGSRVPGKRFIAAFEALYPGTARAFDSPLRTLLRGDEVARGWIDEQLAALPAPIIDLLLFPFPVPRGSLPIVFLHPFDDQRARQLARMGGFRALEAAILLMKLGEITCSPDLRRLAREAYIRMQPGVRAEPVSPGLVDHLFRCIDDAFPRWLHPRPDLRLEVESVDLLRKAPTPRSPDEILAEENLPGTILALTRIAIERRVLEARMHSHRMDRGATALTGKEELTSATSTLKAM
jgi:hypothetical protein